MTKIIIEYLRVALRGFLLAGTVCIFATGAYGQNQCQANTINFKECFVELKKSGAVINVNPPDVGLYSGTKLLWKRTDAKQDFMVDFDIDCTPFVDQHFSQSTPETAHGADTVSASQFERCKYRVTIDGLTVDPHVIVVGGGRDHHHHHHDKHE